MMIVMLSSSLNARPEQHFARRWLYVKAYDGRQEQNSHQIILHDWQDQHFRAASMGQCAGVPSPSGIVRWSPRRSSW